MKLSSICQKVAYKSFKVYDLVELWHRRLGISVQCRIVEKQNNAITIQDPNGNCWKFYGSLLNNMLRSV